MHRRTDGRVVRTVAGGGTRAGGTAGRRPDGVQGDGAAGPDAAAADVRRGCGRAHPARGPARAARRARLAARPDRDRQAERRAPAAAGGVRDRPRRRSRGRPALEALLADPQAEVRQAAAFGLGLLGDTAAVPALLGALANDASPLVRGRAAEALGLIGDPRRRPPSARLVTGVIASGALAGVQADEMRLAARARSRGLPARHLRARAAQGGRRAAAGDPRRRGQAEVRLVADRLRAAAHRRSAHAARRSRRCSRATGSTARRSRRRGSGLSKRPDLAVPPLLEVLASPTPRTAVRLQAVRGLGRLGDRAGDRAAGRAARRADARAEPPARDRDRARRAEGGAGGRAAARSPVRSVAGDAGRGDHRARGDRRRELPAGALGPRPRSGLDGARRGGDARSRRSATRCPRRRGSRTSTTPIARTWPATMRALARAKTPEAQGVGRAADPGAAHARGRDRPRDRGRPRRRDEAGRRASGC